MHALARLALATSLVAATATATLAQPSDTPAAPTPASADVSTLDGQLVKVGEHNEYLYPYKHTILSLDPLGWVIGLYGVSGSYGIDDHIAIRGELDYVSLPGSHSESFEADLGVPIYLRRTYQGAFLEPGFVVRQTQTHDSYSYDASGSPTSSTTTSTVYGPQVLVGWHWTWDSGLNVAAAVGIGRNLGYDSNAPYGGSDRYIPNAYLRFGYAF